MVKRTGSLGFEVGSPNNTALLVQLLFWGSIGGCAVHTNVLARNGGRRRGRAGAEREALGVSVNAAKFGGDLPGGVGRMAAGVGFRVLNLPPKSCVGGNLNTQVSWF